MTPDEMISVFTTILEACAPVWRDEPLGALPPDVASLLHPDFELHEAPSLPFGGVWRGPEGLLALMKEMQSSWDLQLGEQDILAANDSLVLRMDMKGTSKVTGQSFDVSVCEVWDFRDDLVIRMTPYYF